MSTRLRYDGGDVLLTVWRTVGGLDAVTEQADRKTIVPRKTVVVSSYCRNWSYIARPTLTSIWYQPGSVVVRRPIEWRNAPYHYNMISDKKIDIEILTQDILRIILTDDNITIL
jgi:hypothetical protein